MDDRYEAHMNAAGEQAHRLVREEQARQIEQWGYQEDKDDATWLTILVEEVGESAQAMLSQKDTDKDHLITEVTQVAAVALSWLRLLVLDEGTYPYPTGPVSPYNPPDPWK